MAAEVGPFDAIADALALLRPPAQNLPERIEVSRAKWNDLANSPYVVADPKATADTMMGLPVKLRNDVPDDFAEVVMRDGSRRKL